MSDDSKSTLLPQHGDLIRASAISPEVAAARGYQSITSRAELQRLGFTKPQQIVPSLLIPIRGVSGEIATYQIRPDQPRIGKKGRVTKYETPKGSTMVLDVPALSRPALGNPRMPLFVTEGARKADAAVSRGLCCVALLGVWNWRGTNDQGGRTALADWEFIALNDRHVYIVFDSDVTSKSEVRRSLLRLKAFLENRGAIVRVVHLPSGDGGIKVGLDDFLAAGRTVADLTSLAGEHVPLPVDAAPEEYVPYEATSSGLIYLKAAEGGTIPVPLTNFTAKITKDITEDDGVETRRSFEIEAVLKNRSHRFGVAASSFSTMGWVVEHLGASAVIFPGASIRDHSRVAVQLLSQDIEMHRVFAHLGWRSIDGRFVYLHAGGAIGPDGSIPNMEVVLADSLRRYVLPEPPPLDVLTVAIRGSAGILDVAPPRVSVPTLAVVYRAPLGRCDLSGHLVGPTGEGKTALAALAQQHFGPGLDAQNLPGSWTSTANALEALAFAAKDALFVVDDFVPKGTTADLQRLHREAERLFRAQANASARQRMRPDATLRPSKPPRGLILSTGEDVPRGQSLRARLIIIEVSPGDVNWSRLTEAQRDASRGLYAQAMAGFLKWLAPQYELVQRRLPDEVRELRDRAYEGAQHKRTAFAVANLALGMRYFISFARDLQALSGEECDRLWDTTWAALGEVAEAQSRFLEAAEPTGRYLELLSAAIASGHAHVANPSGGPPPSPEAWGWRRDDTHATLDAHWRPIGDRVGWLEQADLYLEPEASYAVAQRMAREGGEGLSIAAKTLHKRLDERRYLVSTEPGRGTLTIRRSLEGARRHVLHLRAASLIGGKPAQSAQDAVNPGADGQFPWADSWADSGLDPEKPAQETRPGSVDAAPETDVKGSPGQIGQIPVNTERRPIEQDATPREVIEL
ncbi:MAG: DUF3854 domain-containing protein [Acidobacteriia bacterium]|nr:DUF3854 domain-containing protein [Terriglobia bacterium]